MRSSTIPVFLSIISITLAAPAPLNARPNCSADNYNTPECRQLLAQGPQDWELEVSKKSRLQDDTLTPTFNNIKHTPPPSSTVEDVEFLPRPLPTDWIPAESPSRPSAVVAVDLVSPSRAFEQLPPEQARKLRQSLMEEYLADSELSAASRWDLYSKDRMEYIRRCRDRVGSMWHARKLKYFPAAQASRTVEIGELMFVCGLLAFVLGAVLIEKSVALTRAARKLAACFRPGRISLNGDVNSWPGRGRKLYRDGEREKV